MPQPKYKISKQLLKSLKWELEKKVYYPINSKLDCNKVGELILKTTGKSVSESTLYRMLLRPDNQHSPYLHTLEILAVFLNYKNWFELENRLFELIQFQYTFGAIPNDTNYTSLLSYNLRVDSLKPVYQFFEQFSSDLSLDKKAILGEEIFLSLKNCNNNLNFFKQFHSLPIVREGFFEIFADPDFTLPNYETGLTYYLKGIKPHDSLKSFQDYLFANSLLLRHYFISGEKDKVLKIGSLLYKNLEIDKNILNEIYIFPKIRYFSYKLFYNYVQKGFDELYWEWLYDYSITTCADLPELEKRIVIHTILDVLQIDTIRQEKIYNNFKVLYPDLFSLHPTYVNKLSMSEKIDYLDANGSRFITKNRMRVHL
jgi:hypothetical protein